MIAPTATCRLCVRQLDRLERRSKENSGRLNESAGPGLGPVGNGKSSPSPWRRRKNKNAGQVTQDGGLNREFKYDSDESPGSLDSPSGGSYPFLGTEANSQPSSLGLGQGGQLHYGFDNCDFGDEFFVLPTATSSTSSVGCPVRSVVCAPGLNDLQVGDAPRLYGGARAYVYCPRFRLRREFGVCSGPGGLLVVPSEHPQARRVFHTINQTVREDKHAASQLQRKLDVESDLAGLRCHGNTVVRDQEHSCSGERGLQHTRDNDDMVRVPQSTLSMDDTIESYLQAIEEYTNSRRFRTVAYVSYLTNFVIAVLLVRRCSVSTLKETLRYLTT